MAKNVLPVIIKSVAVGLLVLLTMGLYGFALALHQDTLVNGWIPVAASAAVGLLSAVWGWKLWRKVTEMSVVWVNYLVHAVIATGLVLALFYSLNYYCADAGSQHEVKAVIVRRFTQTRHRSERVGRRYYRQGAPYKVYFIEMELPDGRKKQQELPFSEYRRYHKGDTLTLQIRRGLFDIPVIED